MVDQPVRCGQVMAQKQVGLGQFELHHQRPPLRVDDVVNPGVGQVSYERRDDLFDFRRCPVGIGELLGAPVRRLHAELFGGSHLVDQVGRLPGDHDQGVLAGGVHRG